MPSGLNGLIGLKYKSNLGKLYQAVSAKYLQRYNEIIEVIYMYSVQLEVKISILLATSTIINQ